MGIIKTPSILIVDDRPDNLFFLELIFKNEACNVIKAQSGNEALLKVTNQDFAVILLDVQMPEMDGFETAQLMRANQKTSHIPIIFVTAFTKEKDTILKGYQSGAVDYIFKPLHPEIIKNKVRVFLDLYTQKKIIENNNRELEKANKLIQKQQKIVVEEERNRVLLEMAKEKVQIKYESKKKEAMMFELDKLAEVGQLAAGIAHELNTPTTYVRGNMQTFGKYTKIIAELVEQLQNNISDAEKEMVLNKITKLIKNMKEIAESSFTGTTRIMKIISSMKSFVSTKRNIAASINIYTSIQDALILIFNRIKYSGNVFINKVEFTTKDIKFFDTFPAISIQGSDARYAQLFIILFNNSIDAWELNPDKHKTPLRIDINLTQQNDAVKIEIQDNAGGIPEKLLNKIFEPFYTTKADTGGTGLGLSIAKQIAAEHNSRLLVKTMPGEGTCFEIKISVLTNSSTK